MTTWFDANCRHRRSIRLAGHDYHQAGAYFVTLCTYLRELLFDDPFLRQVAEAQWERIPRHCMARHFPHVQLDAWVVMPNHLHGIIVITNDPCRGEASQATGSPAKPLPVSTAGFVDETASGDASPLPQRHAGAPPGSLGAIVGNYKAVTARRINRLRDGPGLPVWQRNYYEHVVRDERALIAIRHYITENPARWTWDTYNPSATGRDTQAAELWRLLQEQRA